LLIYFRCALYKTRQTIIHTAEDFYHTASQPVMLYGENLHSIAKQSSAILSHSEFLELRWQSIEPIAGILKKHIFCYAEPHKLLVGR